MNAEKNIQPLKNATRLTPIERLLSKVTKTESGCWLYGGAKTKDGYGKFTIGRTTVTAHREIPDGLKIDHLCKVRNCINPDHLEAVTQRENLMRGNTLQAKNAAKTHCKNGHEFTPQNTQIVCGWRQCRECRIASKAKRRRKEGRKIRGRYETKSAPAKDAGHAK